MSVRLPQSSLPRIGLVSTHGYGAAEPPFGAAVAGRQVVSVLELSKRLTRLGHEVYIWTRRFADQPEMDAINDRAPCGGREFLAKEYLVRFLGDWSENALRFIADADPADLGLTIVKVLRYPPLAARLSRKGAHKARSLFTWTGLAQPLIPLIAQRAAPRAVVDSSWDEPWNDGD